MAGINILKHRWYEMEACSNFEQENFIFKNAQLF